VYVDECGIKGRINRGYGKVNSPLPPAYSSDINPIEKDWANMKRALRDAAPLCDLLQTAIYNYWR
jgi:hypothetical protein